MPTESNRRDLVPIDRLMDVAAELTGTPLKAIVSDDRGELSVRARLLVVALAIRLTTLSHPNIGAAIGRTRSRVVRLVKAATEQLQGRTWLSRAVAEAEARLAVSPPPTPAPLVCPCCGNALTDRPPPGQSDDAKESVHA